MGADGHIKLVDKKKLQEILSKEDYEFFRDSCPACMYDRDFNGTEIITIYHGDNIYTSWSDPADWYDKGEEERINAICSVVDECMIDTWEVWT